MRLLMFRDDGGRRPGALRPGSRDEVVDLHELARAVGAPAPPPDLLSLIEGGEEALAAVRRLLDRLEAAPVASAVRQLDDLTLLAPLDPPRGNVLAIGRNYAKHAEEGARARGTEVGPPTIFTKAITSIAGPYDDLPVDPRISEQIDWEVELGVVIGRAGVNIPRERALEHVFGYTVVNDVSARDIQHGWGGQWFKGKSLDASCPCGPWIVTRDEVPDPQDLRLRLSVNGVVKQEASTRDMIYPVDALIAWLSVGMTLLPGTLIATGTPEGVGFARTPPEFLRPGDVCEAEVEGVGTIRNRVVAAREAVRGATP
ncbi:MAG TPA: fumarylacetoacetate hydrolase family protein [Candidatus Dormibacteraeota bacterium]|nr:fumarylacetoacetate hydrolase family protein [Candidatus Dormibacteraeota bacterium]